MSVPADASGSARTGSPRAADDVLVVGGGAIGMAIAESLACEGLRVRLLEADDVASGASGAAAGMLAPISEAQADGPLLRLGLESLRRFDPLCGRLKDETGIDPELEPSGLLQLAFSEAECRRLEARRAALDGVPRSSGWPRSSCLEWIDADLLRTEQPAVDPSIMGALHSSLECHLRPPLFVRALAASARARGVEIETGVRATGLRHEGRRILGVETDGGRRNADQVVLAAGPWTPGLLEAARVSPAQGGRLEIEPVRGQILMLEAPLPAGRSIVWSDGIYFVPKRDGSWIVGATEERVGFDRRVTADGVRWLLDRAREVFPSLGDASFARAWAGLRPVSGDGVPWIGSVPGWQGLFLAAGHGRNGVLLAPITAERIRDEILGKDGVDPAHPVHAARGFSELPG